MSDALHRPAAVIKAQLESRSISLPVYTGVFVFEGFSEADESVCALNSTGQTRCDINKHFIKAESSVNLPKKQKGKDKNESLRTQVCGA